MADAKVAYAQTVNEANASIARNHRYLFQNPCCFLVSLDILYNTFKGINCIKIFTKFMVLTLPKLLRSLRQLWQKSQNKNSSALDEEDPSNHNNKWQLQPDMFHNQQSTKR